MTAQCHPWLSLMGKCPFLQTVGWLLLLRGPEHTKAAPAAASAAMGSFRAEQGTDLISQRNSSPQRALVLEQ